MEDIIGQYGLFLAKAVTVVVAVAAIFLLAANILGRARGGGKERLEVKHLNDKYDAMAHAVKSAMLSRKQLKRFVKQDKAQKKAGPQAGRKRVYVLRFNGDIRASNIASLREEITGILTVATPADEVFVQLQSGGGLVHSYGLAASQLVRIKKRDIPLTVAVDTVAASGGYMMACVADRIVAAPFAIVGSIGVVAQVPNFHRWLEKNDIDYEQFTAGEFKRTVTMFGENTEKARAKFREEIEETHKLFKEFVAEHRPALDMDRVSTGEYWHGARAVDLQLVDQLITSDDYLLERAKDADLYEVKFIRRQPVGVRIPWFVGQLLKKNINHGVHGGTG